jgi:hypothetical protein
MYMFDAIYSFDFKVREKGIISFYNSLFIIFFLIYINIVELISMVYFIINKSIVNIISGYFVWFGAIFITISIFYIRKRVNRDKISQEINFLSLKLRHILKITTVSYILLTVALYIWIVLISIKIYHFDHTIGFVIRSL